MSPTYGRCDACGAWGSLPASWAASGEHGDLTPWQVCAECDAGTADAESVALAWLMVEGLTLAEVAALT